MSRIEYRGDIEEIVRAVLQVATNRAMAGRSFSPENAPKLVSDVLSQLRVNVSTMTKERALSLLRMARETILTHDWQTVGLQGEFTEQELDALVFLMRSARDGRPISIWE
ncbi:MAG: hypothetical protein WBE91_05165 [Steroidobacteraceae bacterium]